MRRTYLRVGTTVGRWLSGSGELRRDDRGELNSSIYWTGAMVLLASAIAALVSGKAQAFADGIDFGP